MGKRRRRRTLAEESAQAMTRTPRTPRGDDAPHMHGDDLRLEITYLDPRKLKLWDANPRRNHAAAKKLAPVIKENGFGQPVTMRREDGIVYKGNTRTKAALILRLDAIPVMVRSYPNVRDAIDDAIADNWMHEMSGWDEDRLVDLMKEQDSVDIKALARRTGFEVADIEGLRDGGDPDVSPAETTGAKKPHKVTCPSCGHEWDE